MTKEEMNVFSLRIANCSKTELIVITYDIVLNYVDSACRSYDEGDLEVEGDEAMWTFDGKNEYFWVDQNCDQYGFVLRYSASKEDVTRIAYESWHYRYVGIGNALTMTNMGLSLEEYVNFIKDYSYNGTRYYITADNGDIYCTYYVKSNGQDGQKIPIPKTARSYQISGNNIDGFIIAALVGNEQE